MCVIVYYRAQSRISCLVEGRARAPLEVTDLAINMTYNCVVLTALSYFTFPFQTRLTLSFCYPLLLSFIRIPFAISLS